jgi:hypothetical protein
LRLLTNNIKILSHIHIEVNKETYKAYFRQRIDEKFAATETNVPKTPPLTRNKRKSMGVGSNFISGLRSAIARPAAANLAGLQTDRPVQGMGWMSQPSGSQTYDDRMGALNQSDPYALQRGFASSAPTPEEQAEIDKNKSKTPAVPFNPRWLNA